MVEMYIKKEMNLFGIMYSWFLAKVQSNCCSSPGRSFLIGRFMYTVRSGLFGQASEKFNVHNISYDVLTHHMMIRGTFGKKNLIYA